MGPVDWSWGERYDSPVFVAAPVPVPNPTMSSAFSFNSPSLHMSAPPVSSHILSGISIQNVSAMPHRPQILTTTSRKRSRDKYSDGDDYDDSSRGSSIRRTPSPSKQELDFGSGMTLRHSDGPGHIAECSRTGAWAEELSERLKSSHVGDRPILESRKSIRLAPDAPEVDNTTMAGLPEDVRIGSSIIETPVIDEATRTLGISWTSMSSSPTMEAASRGWARYIQNHFPLQRVEMVWQNKTIPAYLISAITKEPYSSQGSPGYYLFDETLAQGRLIAKSWERAVDCLRASPMAFEGEHVMLADEPMHQQGTSQAPVANAMSTKNDELMDGVSGVALHTLEPGSGDGMDIDMS